MTSKEALEIIIKENKQIPAIYVGCESDLYTKLGVEFDIIREDLCALEQIEKELGIDLITFFKALKNGIYGTSYGEKLRKESAIIYVEPSKLKLHLNDEEPSFHYLWGFPYDTSIYLFKDYGITWALTKERLENGK